MGVPRANASLGVVSFGNAYFHPKVYHARRHDGSQAAYVGSANLSAAGLALHVEAGISLDTRDGDDEASLHEIASAIDDWFEEARAGLYLIQDIQSVEALVGISVLATAPEPKPATAKEPSVASYGHGKWKLKPVVSLPPVNKQEGTPADEPASDEVEEEPADASGASGPPGAGPTLIQISTPIPTPAPTSALPAASTNTSVPKNGFPQYLLFDPTANGPTDGRLALTGSALPSGAAGLIVQLNLDSARHFMGGKGTANISVPIAAIGTIRFGVSGVHSRPRAEFALRIRYLSGAGSTVESETATTNIQGYGYTPTESGHADIRMLVPAQIKYFGYRIEQAGYPVPTNGEFALLEWPSYSVPVFGLTFLEPDSNLANNATAAFAAAVTSGQVVGQGACWLQPGVSPPW